MKNSEKAVGYSRVSTDMQSGPDHYSLALQAEILAEMAVQHDTRLTAVFTDVGSGTKTNRTGLQQLREAIKRPDVKWLFVYRLNRLARNLKLLLSIFELCQKNNVKVISKMESQITGTASGQLQLSVFGAVSEFEKEVLKENQGLALAEKKQRGEVLSSRVPYGYIYQDKHAVVDPETSLVVKWLYQQYIAADKGYRQLTAACNQRFNITLNQAHVARMLRNEHYVGKDPNYPCLISESVFNQAQAKRAGKRSKKAHNDSWLHGKLVCPVCERKLLVEATTRNGKRTRYYSCRRHGHSFSVRGEVVEQLVWNRLSYMMQKSSWVEAIQLKIPQQLNNQPVTNDDLRKQLEVGQIDSTEFIERFSKSREIRLKQQQMVVDWVKLAFNQLTTTSTDFWQDTLDHVDLSTDKLIVGIFMRRWPMVNLLNMEEK